MAKVTVDKAKVEALVKHYISNIFHFIEDFLPHHLEYKTPEFHREILNFVVSSARLALAAPRGFAKSTIVCVFAVIWMAVLKQKKDICIISASEGLAIEWLRKIKLEFETNEKLRAVFGDLKSDKWTESQVVLRNGVTIRARGAGAQIRGFRPDLIILDDIETDESVASEDQRNKLRDWIFKACLNALTTKGQFIIIGTIISPLALLEEMLTNNNDWVKKKYRAYIDGIQEPGHELWQENWNHERLQQRKKEIGTFAFASEFMNDPVSNENAPIKRHQIRHWETLPKEYSCVITVDPAYGEDERADYKVASLVGIDQQKNRYLISYIRTHAPSGEFINSIINLWLQNRNIVTAVGLPHGGGDKEFFNSFMRICQDRKIFPPVVELSNSFTQINSDRSIRKKTPRIIASLQPLFESGQYYINKNHIEAEDELLSLGFSKHDDLVDTLAYAEQILTPVVYNASEDRSYRDEDLEEYSVRNSNYGMDY